MLPARNWRAEEVLHLGLALLLTLAGTLFLFSLLGLLAGKAGHPLPPLAGLVAGNLGLQLPALVLLHRFFRSHGTGWIAGLGLRPRQPVRAVALAGGLCAGALLVGYPLQAGIAAAMQRLGWEPESQAAIRILQESGWGGRLMVGWFAVGVAPAVEEALFRGVLFPFFRDRGWTWAAWGGTSLLFGLAHGNAAACLPLALFGLGLCWLYRQTGSLSACLLAHGLFNVAGFLVAITGSDPFPAA